MGDFEAKRRNHLRLRTIAMLVVLLAGSLLLLVLASPSARDLADLADSLSGPELLLMAIGIGILSIVLTPAALLSAAAGYVAGVAAGTLVALGGLCLGAAFCAILARIVGSEEADALFGPRVERLAGWIKARPFHSVALARLIPGVPFHLTSYAAGLARVGLPTLTLATAIGFGPRCFVFVALGGSLGNLERTETQIAIGLSAAILIVLYWAARRSLLSIAEEEQLDERRAPSAP